jgi:hypothetical protein
MTVIASQLPPGVDVPTSSSNSAPSPIFQQVIDQQVIDARPPQVPEEPPVQWHIPKLWLKVEDMASAGSLRVFKALGVNPVAFLHECVVTIYELLYTRDSAPKK